MDYDVHKQPWYSPARIIKECGKLAHTYGSKINDPVFKRTQEMFMGAIILLGAYEIHHENKYFMQSNNQSSTPDVMGAKLTEVPNQPILLEMVQIELVTMEAHAETNDPYEFLIGTKLSKHKSYSENDLIALVINKQIDFAHKGLHHKLKARKPKSTIYTIGKPTNKEGNFMITCVWPRLTKTVIFAAGETAKKYSIPDRVSLHRGTAQKITYKSTKIQRVNTLEVFGLKSEIIEKKFPPSSKRRLIEQHRNY